MDEYIVWYRKDKEPDINYTVHKLNKCPLKHRERFFPPPEARINLGNHNDCKSALKKAEEILKKN